MSQPDADKQTTNQPSAIIRMLDRLGAPFAELLEYLGGLAWLIVDLSAWILRSFFSTSVRIGRLALYDQVVRVGVKSVAIIGLVSAAIGFILVMQMAGPLDEFGQVNMVANINAEAILREMGPLISAIVLTGFAGASIAAELGTMVVGEEIEAMESMALNPVRFLVVPRVLATVIGLLVLTVFADAVALTSGALFGVFVLDIPWAIYLSNTLEQASLGDFFTGVVKGGVFGLLIGLIACYQGLRVSGGAAGVGQATTRTVVHSIVAIVMADLLFTTIFFILG